MTIYLRKPGGRVWHWCRNCSALPAKGPLEVRYARPESGGFCAECQRLAKIGACALNRVDPEDAEEQSLRDSAALSW